MTSFLDTSVLVAAFWEDHPRHAVSLDLFHGLQKKESACAAHSLAEVYAVLTRLPVKITPEPEQVLLSLEQTREHLSIITLDESEYWDTLKNLAENRLPGGRIYDALILRCAEKSKAKTIYTWNLTHFQTLAPHLAGRIQTP